MMDNMEDDNTRSSGENSLDYISDRELASMDMPSAGEATEDTGSEADGSKCGFSHQNKHVNRSSGRNYRTDVSTSDSEVHITVKANQKRGHAATMAETKKTKKMPKKSKKETQAEDHLALHINPEEDDLDWDKPS